MYDMQVCSVRNERNGFVVYNVRNRNLDLASVDIADCNAQWRTSSLMLIPNHFYRMIHNETEQGVRKQCTGRGHKNKWRRLRKIFMLQKQCFRRVPGSCPILATCSRYGEIRLVICNSFNASMEIWPPSISGERPLWC